MKNIIIIVFGALVGILSISVIYLVQVDNENIISEPNKGYFEVSKEKKEHEEEVLTEIEDNKNLVKETGSSNECEKDGKVYFDIPELGIKVLVNEDVKDDLIYSDVDDNYGYSVVVSSKKLIGMDLKGYCSVNGKNGSGAFLIRKIPLKDYPNMRARISSGEIKQIGQYFVMIDRQDRCSLLSYEDYVVENSFNVMKNSGAKCIKEIK